LGSSLTLVSEGFIYIIWFIFSLRPS
jgi:hypothetical protein